MAKLVIIPGVCGSGIQLDRWVYDANYWVDPGALVANGPFPLQVNSEGTGDLEPHYGWKRTIVRGPLRSYYGRLFDFFASLGWGVLPLGYDWRLGVRTVAADAWARVRAWAGDGDVYLIGHSLGGMVGRGMLRVADEAGQLGQVKRLVTLGTPQLGTLSIPNLWARRDRTYKLLAVLFYPALKVAQALHGVAALDVLDSVVATLVSPYSILPQPGSPVFTEDGQYDKLFSRSSYNSFNAWLSQERFDAAKVEQQWLKGAVYPSKQLSVVGLGIQTATRIKDVLHLNRASAYEYTDRGDGQVDLYSAALPDVPQLQVSGVEHFAFPYDPAVLPRLPDLLLTGL